MELRGYFATNEPTSLRLASIYGEDSTGHRSSSFVGERSEEEPDAAQVTFRYLAFVRRDESGGTYTPVYPETREDLMLYGSSVRVDRELLDAGDAYDGEDRAAHRSFGYADVEVGGKWYGYTCQGLWREDI